MRDNQIIWAPGEDYNERGNNLTDQGDEIGSWARESASNYNPKDGLNWQKEKEILRERKSMAKWAERARKKRK